MAKKKKHIFWRFLAKLIALLIGLNLLFILSVYLGLTGHIPSKKDIASIRQENASVIYSSDGRTIGKIYAKNRTLADSADLPQHLIDALVATEDKRFFEHKGVDLRSYGRVIVRSIILMDESGGGGSTITQQLAKNLYGRPEYWIFTLPISKIREIIIARRLEKVYSKHELLVLYFNTVPFGENTWGIEAAASRFFNLDVSDLRLPQAALLVGMLKANTAFNPRLNPDRAIARRNTVLSLMQEQGIIDSTVFKESSHAPLTLDYTNYDLYNPSGYFAFQVRNEARKIIAEYNKQNGTSYDLEKDGLEISSTLNYQLQIFAVNAAKKQLIEKQRTLDKELANSTIKKDYFKRNEHLLRDTTKKYRNVFNWSDSDKVPITKMDSAWMYQSLLSASVLVVDPTNGEVLVWVGGNSFRHLPYDLVLAERQSASVFKPFVYAAALEGGFNKCDYFLNEAVSYPEFENWKPENYDGEGEGEAAMWYALSQSLNVPTVDLYFKTGHSQVERTAAGLGLILPKEELPALALGTHSFSLKQITRAYAAFSNRGYINDLSMISEIVDASGKVIYKSPRVQGRKAVSTSTAEGITEMLIKAVNEGTGRRMAGSYGVRSTLAGKTGTSQNYSDAWFLSYTQDLACGVWVGAMSPQIHFRSGGHGSGSALALPIAARFYKNVEGNSVLRKKYMTGFGRLDFEADSVLCDPIREITRQSDSTETGFVKRIWRKIFKRD